MTLFSRTDKFTITACFVVNCVRSLISKDTGVLLKFLDFVHHWSQLLDSKLTQWNLDFIFLRGTCTMNVKATEWKWIFKTYFCRVSDAPRRHIWSSHGDVFHCPAANCEQMKHNIKKFSVISHHLTASFFRTWHRLLQMEAQQHLTHSCNFKINSKATSLWKHRVLWG